MRVHSLIATLCSLLLVVVSQAQEETRNYALGPIGGQYRITPNSSYARVVSLDAAAPGAVAGLRVDDLIYGAFGKTFTPTGAYHYGVSQELGFAVDRAEGSGGALPLKVLRPGTGLLDVTVTLPTAGAFGAAYPRQSAKHQQMFDNACDYLHQRATNANGDLGYFTGWTGLALLGHPNWNSTTGAKPYRLSINKIRDFCVNKITNGVYAGVEDRLFDGSPNPNYQSGTLSNWELGQMVMFLSEYYEKTNDATVAATLQRGAEMCANSVQWWKQPAQNANGYSPAGSAIAGWVGHGGVTGDYMHMGWGGGINMCGVYSFNGMAFARRVGMNMNARPRDGHYFGYATAPVGAVEVGKENYDPTLDEKFLMQWNWMGTRCAYYNANSNDDGHVAYTTNAPSGYDAAGRTAATLLGMCQYQAAGGVLTADEEAKLEKMKGYITRHYIRQQDAHAYCLGAQMYQALCMPYLSDRQQRFAMDNWRFYYALSRTHNGGFQYFRGRNVNDNYLDETHCAALDVAMPYAVANGGLNLVPGYNTAPNRVIANFTSPDMSWPTIAARKITTTNATLAMPTTIVDGTGNTLAEAAYTASWTKLSGPSTATFSQPSKATTNITFGSSGNYRIQLIVTRNGYTLTEPIDVVVQLQSAPAGYELGKANYQVYTGIDGSTVANLTAHAKYTSNSPDITRTVTTLAGDYSGDDFGARITGIIIPPTTENYRFYIASDDSSQFKLNANGTDPAGASVIASVSGSTSPLEWKKNTATQQSAVLSLTAGQPMYFEVLHKEDGGGEHVAVGWSTDDGVTINVIDGVYLAAAVAAQPTTMAITQQPQAATAALGGTVNFTIATNGPTPAYYQWRRNGVAVGPPTTTPELTLSNISGGAEGNYDCVYTTNLGALTSNSVHLTISNAGNIVAGGLWREVYTGIGGGSVSDLTSAAKFPLSPEVSGAITSAYTPSGFGDDYGQRWTGWVKPAVSGNYRFYLSADDTAELWLSTDELPANKVRILQLTSYTSDRSWSSKAPSAYIPLVAGKRYYIEMLHKEGGGGDACGVAWQREGDPVPANGANQIPGQYLEYRAGGTYDDVPLSNVAPEFTANPIDMPDGAVNLAYASPSLATQATDFNSADNLTFSKVSGPTWLTVAANGTLGGTPQAANQGLNTFTVRVADAGGLSVQATLRITVGEANLPPSFTANPLNFPDAVVLVPIGGSLATAANDPNAADVASLVYTKTSGPAWLSIANNGALSGTPTAGDIGMNSFSVKVTDRFNANATTTLRINVLPPNFYYDINGSVTGSGASGGGVWDGTSLWTGSLNGTSATFAWVDTATPIFAAGNDASGAYTVTVSGNRIISGLTARTGTPTLTGGGLALNNSSNPFAINSANARIDTPISGSAKGLEKTGTGTLVLGGSNTYTGNTDISNGVLELAPAGKLYNGGSNSTAVITAHAGGTWRVPDFSSTGVGRLADAASLRVLDGGTFEVTGPTHSSDRAFTVSSNGGVFRYTPSGETLTLSPWPDVVLNGTLTFETIGTITTNARYAGTGGLSKTGAGTLILDYSGNTFSGDVLVSAGTLQSNRGGSTNCALGAVTGSRTITIDNATLHLNTNDQFGGSGKSAAVLPTLVVRNNSTLSATTYNAIGNVTLSNSTLSQSSTSSYDGYEILGTITVTGTAPSAMTASGGKSNSLLGNSSGGSTVFDVADVTGNASADLTVSTGLRNPTPNYSGTGSGALTKTGAGTMVLSASCSYSGGTTITGGTLEVAGSLNSGSAVNVQAGGRLAGTGTVSGTVGVSGKLAPGSNGVGTLTTGALTLQSGSTMEWDLGASTTHDKVTAPSLTFSGSPAITLRLTGANPAANGANVTIPLITLTTGTISNFSTATFTVDKSAIPGATGTWKVIQSGDLKTLSLSIETGYNTAWRDANFGANANNPSIAGPAADPDGDGVSNIAEQYLGLNPNNPNSRLSLNLMGIPESNGMRSFRMGPAVTAGTYTLEIANSPAGPWTANVPVTVSSPATTFDFNLNNSYGGHFFRLRYAPPTPP